MQWLSLLISYSDHSWINGFCLFFSFCSFTASLSFCWLELLHRFSGFLAQSEEAHIRLIGNTRLPLCKSMGVLSVWCCPAMNWWLTCPSPAPVWALTWKEFLNDEWMKKSLCPDNTLWIQRGRFSFHVQHNSKNKTPSAIKVLLLLCLRFTSQVNQQPAIKIPPCDSNPREASVSFFLHKSVYGFKGVIRVRVFNCLLMNNEFQLKQKAALTCSAPCWTLIKHHKFLLIPAEKSTSCRYIKLVFRTCQCWCSID